MRHLVKPNREMSKSVKKEKPMHQQKTGMGSDLSARAMKGYLRGVLHGKMKTGKATQKDVSRYLQLTQGGKKKPKKTYTGPKGGRYSDPQHKHGISMTLKSEDGMEQPRTIDPDTLCKSMYDFHLGHTKGAKAVPDAYLAEYLDSFLEEAWEHERQERSHTDPNLVPHTNDLTGYLAGCVFRELMAFLPHNTNLTKAVKKFTVTKEYVEERLRAMNLLHVDSENQNANQKASTSGYHPTPLALSEDAAKGVQYLGEAEHRDAQEKAFVLRKSQKVEMEAGPDPMELLHNRLEESDFGGTAESAEPVNASDDPHS